MNKESEVTIRTAYESSTKASVPACLAPVIQDRNDVAKSAAGAQAAVRHLLKRVNKKGSLATKTHLIVENDVFPKNARFLQFDKELRRGVDDYGYILIDPVKFLLKHDLFPEYKDTNLDAGELCTRYLHSLSLFGMSVFTNPTDYNSEKMIIIRHDECFPGNVEAITALVTRKDNKVSNFTHLDCKKEGCKKESAKGKGGYCANHVPKVSCLFVVFVVSICQCSTHCCLLLIEMHRFKGARAAHN